MIFRDFLYGFGIGWFRGWIAVVGLGLLAMLIFTGKFNVLSLFYTSELELTYAEDLSDVDCINPRFCFVNYRFDIANTGESVQSVVIVVFHGMPEGTRGARKIVPLTTTAVDTAHAEIHADHEEDETTFIIEDFQPGTLIKFEYIDKRMPRESGERLLEGVAEVEGRGRHIIANPKATAFGRFLSAIF